jgi:regulator of protease activity HflC (stomatin/prohibitin superfamily)
MAFLAGVFVGFIAYLFVRYGLFSLYTVEQNERAVKTSFGRAERLGDLTTATDPVSDPLTPEEKIRYAWPQVKVIGPGGPYFKMPWERVHKVVIATSTHNIAFDPENPYANQNNTVLEAVTKDHLNTGLSGQIRFRVSERNLYAFLFGVKNPAAHVMGYFVSILRERIANFEAPRHQVDSGTGKLADAASGKPLDASVAAGVSINDLRKNLRDVNEHVERECSSSAARYGIEMDATLVTSIDPPPEVDSALAAINTAHNQVSSDISLAQAAADQRIVESKRAVEIETLRAQAEVEPLNWMAAQLRELKAHGSEALPAYLRNIRLELYRRAKHIILEIKNR